VFFFGQSSRKAVPDPKFSELSREDGARLEQQRAVVAAAVMQRYGTTALTRTKSDLPVLQNLIDGRVFKKSHVRITEPRCRLGDVLAGELPYLLY
jgi:hypothetical protein